ncbi:MAG TPA: hypothetical protein VKY44_07380, partial [Flavobacterium sp.]|nr:hypothetical protein [Flavobacterium sp.]
MNFFKKWFGNNLKNKEKDTEDDFMKKYLIVGLGNMGAEYVNTRHNIGFKAVDFMAKEAEVAFETVK